ncbi:MAG: WYL domain-containing protein [Chitinophagaceae bacterium]
MATNKHAVIRYQALDKCFRNPGRRYYIDDLVEACNKAIADFTGNETGVKRRQVLEDIKYMESLAGWSIPLERMREGHKVYFKYEDRRFSINNQPLNETEANQLKEALQTIARFKGMPQFEWVDEISARLDSGLGLSQNVEKIIEFEQNNYLKGLEFITPLYNAILYKKTSTIDYQSFRQNAPQSIEFHPYFLKQYNNRWYVFGRNGEFVVNLALDRIISIEESKTSFIPNTSIDYNEYFEDVVGVTVPDGAALAHIVLKVRNELLPYIKTKPMHGSQKLKEQRAEFALVSLDLIPNYELESLILSYGEGIEVLQPETLRMKLKERVEKININYQEKNAE